MQVYARVKPEQKEVVVKILASSPTPELLNPVTLESTPSILQVYARVNPEQKEVAVKTLAPTPLTPG